jgi:hypothetical protein
VARATSIPQSHAHFKFARHTVDKPADLHYKISEQFTNMPNNQPYLPLRVHSVFARGRGAVPAPELADALATAGIPFLAVCDPMSLLAWDSFRAAAVQHNQKPLLGTEIVFPGRGSLLLYPLSAHG